MNVQTGFSVPPETVAGTAELAGSAFAHKLGMRLAISAGLIVLVCAAASGTAILLLPEMGRQVVGIALAGAVLSAFFLMVFAYRFAVRLGDHIQKLGSLVDTVPPSLTGAIDIDGSADTGLSSIGELFERLDRIDRYMAAFARGARTIEAERDQSRQLLTAEAEANTEFFSKMSHELRTPLNAILGYSTLLHEDAADRNDVSSKADLERIQLAGRRLLSLIDDLLEMSGLRNPSTDPELTVFEVSELITELAGRVEDFSERNAAVKIHQIPDGQLMAGDRRKIARCIKSVMDSAVSIASEGIIEIDVLSESDYVEVRIKTECAGQEGDDLARSFEAPSTNDNGHGRSSKGHTSLMVARDLAESMAGDCKIEPGSDQSVTLTLTLPTDSGAKKLLQVSEQLGAQMALDMLADEGDGQHPTVLIIDDDPAAIDLLNRWLSRWGYRVIHAVNGTDGLALARSQKPDLVLLDALMPDKTGYEVLREMREDRALADTPVVLITVDDDRNRGITAGASDYIRKPIGENQLREVVGTYNANVSGDILIIDDDDDASNIMQRNLEKLGFTARCATNGAEGLEMASEKLPGAIVLDLAMPHIDGFEFLQSLGNDARLADIPVIVVSGYNLSLPQHHILKKAGAPYFRKGTSAPREIAETLRELVS